MCLATVYKESDNTVICVRIRDILGEETRVQGKILMVDLANSEVRLVCD